MNPRVLVVGNSVMGLNLTCSRLPSNGETASEEQYFYSPAGKGLNTAVALSRLGGDCVFCTRVGRDANGRQLLSFCKNSGIDIRFVVSRPEDRTALSVSVFENGDVRPRCLEYPSNCREFAPVDLENALTCAPDAMILQLGLSRDAVIAAARNAARRGVPVFADATDCPPEFPLEKLPKLFTFVVNAEAAQRLTGIAPSGVQSCLRICMALEHRMKAVYYIIKLGHRGVFLYDGTYQKLLSAYEVEVSDLAAAGDTFMAAMTVSFIRTVARDAPDMERSCVYANLAAALAVSRPGAAKSVPTSEEVAEFVTVNAIPFTLEDDEK